MLEVAKIFEEDNSNDDQYQTIDMMKDRQISYNDNDNDNDDKIDLNVFIIF